MSWGPCFLYYRCPQCGKKFKYATDLIPEFGDDFGKCPACIFNRKIISDFDASFLCKCVCKPYTILIRRIEFLP